VTFEFGQFRLDELRRELCIGGREVALQPKTFDLLVYLVRNRSRVLSKDELLDAVWPGVTVTDNSLQRAVSALRGALRDVGMEDLVRNFPRNGYRFCVEDDQVRAGKPSSDSPAQTPDAHRAIAEQRWSDAVAMFERLPGHALTGKDLDAWALALQCLGRPAKAIALLTRSTAAHTESNRPDLAAISAATLSTIHLERGEPALAQGWLARALDLLVANQESAAAGYVLWLESRIAAFQGDIDRALALSDRGYELGRKTGDARVEALGLMYRGFYKLCLGETRAGLRDQDHAGAIALSRGLDPATGGTLYCNILWACRTFGDWARANQWTLGYRQFCSDSGLDFSGSCQLHRAEVLGIQGSLPHAIEHVQDSISRLPDDAPWSLGDAYRVLGDIHSAIGNTDEAVAAYDRCDALGWSPEPGRAMLLAERNELEAAYASLESSIAGRSWYTLQRRGVLLAHLALVAAELKRSDRAQALIDEISEHGDRWPMASIRAVTNEASAVLSRDAGDLNAALRRLHLARQLWTSIDSRLNDTRLRIRIAETQLCVNDKHGALTEIRIALLAAQELKSIKLAEKCRAVQSRIDELPR